MSICGLLQNAKPLTEAQVKELEKALLQDNELVLYLGPDGDAHFLGTTDPSLDLKSIAWHKFNKVELNDSLTTKTIFNNSKTEHFEITSILQKQSNDDSWLTIYIASNILNDNAILDEIILD